MKALLIEILLVLSIVPMTLPQRADAAGFIYSPGEPMKVVVPTLGGYNIYDMGGGGNTLVQRMDPYSTMVRRGGEAATFIEGGPDIQMEPVLPVSSNVGIEVPGFE